LISFPHKYVRTFIVGIRVYTLHHRVNFISYAFKKGGGGRNHLWAFFHSTFRSWDFCVPAWIPERM